MATMAPPSDPHLLGILHKSHLPERIGSTRTFSVKSYTLPVKMLRIFDIISAALKDSKESVIGIICCDSPRTGRQRTAEEKTIAK